MLNVLLSNQQFFQKEEHQNWAIVSKYGRNFLSTKTGDKSLFPVQNILAKKSWIVFPKVFPTKI